MICKLLHPRCFWERLSYAHSRDETRSKRIFARAVGSCFCASDKILLQTVWVWWKRMSDPLQLAAAAIIYSSAGVLAKKAVCGHEFLAIRTMRESWNVTRVALFWIWLSNICAAAWRNLLLLILTLCLSGWNSITQTFGKHQHNKNNFVPDK